MRNYKLIVFLSGVATLSAGCRSGHIVSAAPPSVSEPVPEAKPEEVPPSTPAPSPSVTATAPAEPTPAPTPAKRPVTRPRPPQNDTPVAAAPVQPRPAPPQIAPAQLDPAGVAAAKNNTTLTITTARKNLQDATSRTVKELKPEQMDLVDKINGFLSQAEEAMAASDLVSAQNLAEKARVLSIELLKSF